MRNNHETRITIYFIFIVLFWIQFIYFSASKLNYSHLINFQNFFWYPSEWLMLTFRERGNLLRLPGLIFHLDINLDKFIEPMISLMLRQRVQFVVRGNFSHASLSLAFYKSAIHPCIEFCYSFWYIYICRIVSKCKEEFTKLSILGYLVSTLQSLTHHYKLASLRFSINPYVAIVLLSFTFSIRRLHEFKRSSRLLESFHYFAVEFARQNRKFYSNVSFFHTSPVWKYLQGSCFHVNYDHQKFKFNFNDQHVSFSCIFSFTRQIVSHLPTP